MTIQLSVAARNAALDAIETAVGASPTLKFLTGSMPSNCAAAETGTVLATMALPSDWMAAASGGSKAMSGAWADPTADASGAIGYFRIYQGGTCHIQGTCSLSGDGGDMIMDNLAVLVPQQCSVATFTIVAGGA